MFWQTIDEVNRGHISAGERLYQLKALQDASRKHEVRSLSLSLSLFSDKVQLVLFKRQRLRFHPCSI